MLNLTPVFRLYARSRVRQIFRLNGVGAQERQLHRLVRAAATTRFGRDHRFADIRTVDDFQARVPVRTYEDFWKEYWQPSFPRLQDCTWPGSIPYFALTSGTTSGVTKFIPCSDAMVASNRRAMLDVVAYHLHRHPESRLFAGRCFMLGGSASLRELAPDVWCGDLSGIAGKTVPAWARLRYFPPRDLETIADWETKIARLAPASLSAEIRAMGGIPSWLLLFFEKLAQLGGGESRLVDFYPDLEMLIHGGVNFAPYRPAFRRWLAGSRAETREVYPASEGFIASADRGDGEGLRLVVDNGLFYEFIPLEELGRPGMTRHWLGTVETGINYAIAVSTCAGLWSYLIGDTVRFIERQPPRLMVTGRTSYSLSAFGEHLSAEEIDAAITEATEEIGCEITDYVVGAVFPQRDREPGGHLFIVEFATDAPPAAAAVSAFAARLDALLAGRNEDYESHRAGGYGMRPPVAHAVAPGTFAAWMKARGRLGGQNKVPRVINDPELFAHLRAFTGADEPL